MSDEELRIIDSARALDDARVFEVIWQALDGLDDDLLDSNMPQEEVDAELRELGLNPDALRRKGVEMKFSEAAK